MKTGQKMQAIHRKKIRDMSNMLKVLGKWVLEGHFLTIL